MATLYLFQLHTQVIAINSMVATPIARFQSTCKTYRLLSRLQEGVLGILIFILLMHKNTEKSTNIFFKMHFLDFDKTVVNTCLDYKIASQGLQMCSTNYQKNQ